MILCWFGVSQDYDGNKVLCPGAAAALRKPALPPGDIFVGLQGATFALAGAFVGLRTFLLGLAGPFVGLRTFPLGLAGSFVGLQRHKWSFLSGAVGVITVIFILF